MGSRIEKYAKKISGSVRKKLYDDQKERMVRLETTASIDFERIELQVKSMAQGYPALHLPYYMIFAKEIYSKQKKFKSQTLLNEIVILQNKWGQRGLDYILLEKIKAFYVPLYQIIRPFRLDISELDGPHILS